MQGSNANEAGSGPCEAPPAAQGSRDRARGSEPDPIQSRHLR